MPVWRHGQSYPTDIRDDEWAFIVPYLTLLPADALQRRYPLREVFNALRWIARAGAPWRILPHEFPPGRWSTSSCGAGWQRVALRARCMIPYSISDTHGTITRIADLAFL
ncbi:MAG: Mobile element protein [Ktedonobacterales bacterium]|jgi:transposase|nr:MAG: Mobile element protein [Ktedonobacterales bacterium]